MKLTSLRDRVFKTCTAVLSSDNNSIDDAFFLCLLQEIMNSMYQCHTNNIDLERFGSASPSNNDCDQNISFFNDYFRDDYKKVEMLKGGQLQGLAKLFNILQGQHSKELLVKLIVFRLLGRERVKLPLNTPEYWRKREYAHTLIEGNETISTGFMDWKLHLFNLKKIGYPIRLYLVPMSVCARFMIKSYDYRHINTIIKAEEGDYVIDAGGCWGDTALYFGHEVGATGRVYSFEFIPNNLDIMEKNLSLNHYVRERVEVIRQPLWNRTGKTLYFLDNGPGSMVSENRPTEQYVPISTISIDDFVFKHRLKKVDFIKMDIEGAELDALRGAVRTIKKFRPKLAISLYHRFADFSSIPEFIFSLNSDYIFYLGHYTIHAEETVLFAISRSDRKKPKVSS